MPAFRLKRFTNPETLSKTNEALLREFLERFSPYFVANGVLVQSMDRKTASVDLVRLARLCEEPSLDQPNDLADALFHIHELAVGSAEDRLLQASADLELKLPEKPTSIDISIAVWLADSSIHARVHAEIRMHDRQSFQHFIRVRDEAASKPVPIPCPRVIDNLNDRLSAYCHLEHKGGGVTVEPHQYGDELWFVVRHGELYRRENAREGETPTVVMWRPESFDVVIFTQWDHGLRINCNSARLTDEYRRAFGEALFDDDDTFSQKAQYTLSPIRTLGEELLNCDDVPGLTSARLVELTSARRGAFSYSQTWRASDLFGHFRMSGRSLPSLATYVSAVFEVELDDDPKPRRIRIAPPNQTRFVRTADHPLIDAWMRNRCFIQVASIDSTVEPTDDWQAIEMTPGHAAPLLEWKDMIGSAPEQVLAMFKPTGRRAEFIRWSDGRDLRCVHHTDSTVLLDDQNNPVSAVESSQTVVHSLDLDLLFTLIRKAFEFRKRSANAPQCPGIRAIGTHMPFGRHRIPVYFVGASSPEELSTSMDSLIVGDSGPMLVFTLSEQFFDRAQEQLWQRNRCWTFPVSSSLVLNNSSEWVASRPALSRLVEFNCEVLPATVDDKRSTVFPTPPGAKWNDVSIKFISEQTIEVGVLGVERNLSLEEMGLADGRTGQVDSQGALLLAMARRKGTFESPLDPVSRRRDRQHVKDALGRKLKSFFQIDGQPFATVAGVWKCKFKVVAPLRTD